MRSSSDLAREVPTGGVIFVCEPTCKGFEHERVNGGFISALSRAYGEMVVRVYSDRSHFRAVLGSMESDSLRHERVQHQAINPPMLRGQRAVRSYRRILSSVFDDVVDAGCNRVFFLSFDAECLMAIKQLKRQQRFSGMRVALVAHGLMEEIADDFPCARAIRLPIERFPKKGFGKRVTGAASSYFPSVVARSVVSAILSSPMGLRYQGELGMGLREILELDHTDDYRYIFLAPHAATNASKYLVESRFDLYTVTTPVALAPLREQAMNEHVKFAVYGNADQLVLHNLARAILGRRPKADYELKLISSNQFGAEGSRNIHIVGGRGKKLRRSEMEKHAEDVDFFLFLSDKSRYRLSCSGVLFEAFSLAKPLVYFANDCVDQFNTANTPIGIRCETFDEYTDTVIDLIENFHLRAHLISHLRDGVLRRRRALQSEDVVSGVKASFEW
jgi:hypothetical protein